LSRGPYEHLHDHRFWRKAVAEVPPFALDPLISVPFKIASADKVATAGSCFALHIARSLRTYGLNYYVCEAPPVGLSEEAMRRRNYGIFSCRYGNIYTSRHLLQLALRAYERRHPHLDVWSRGDGRLLDPFRPLIEPDGYDSIDALHADRIGHLAAVRRMLETLDVFVFTFGLTECWRSKADGMVLPVAPGVIGGEWREDLFEFWNMRAGDVAADFVAFADLLREVNPKAKVIVTVSPVPLIATYEQRHALVSNAYTKATLRIAVDEICRLRPEIVYFPGYEIATVACNAARFYDDSQRNMTPLGIQQVMRVFFKHFAADGVPSGSAPTARIDVAGEAKRLAAIVCEEDLLDSPDRGG
jgi:GSCFA family